MSSPATRRAGILAVAAGAAAGAFLVLTTARPGGRDLPAHDADPGRGEMLYHVGGCISCHKATATSGIAGPPSGGAPFPTPVGTFWPGNLTPDPETGLGSWTAGEFVDALTRGVSPDRRHYFPAFPYPSYRKMTVEDLLDLWAYLQGLAPVSSPGKAPDMPLPGLARRGVGLWKWLIWKNPGVPTDPEGSDQWNRGAYLVHAPGHCGECHTPRNALMVPDQTRAFAGGPHPSGEEEEVPSLLGLERRGRYSGVSDLTLALQYGETLGYDKLASGGMADVQRNLALLPDEELRAIADYLLSLE